MAADQARAEPRRRQSADRRDSARTRALIVYLDGSALAKLVLVEPGSAHMESLWQGTIPAASSVICYPEVRGVIAAARRARRISARRMERTVTQLDEAWGLVHSIDVDDSLALFAGAVSARHGLRALDAVHLASALSIPYRQCVLVSWDEELRRAASAEGLVISPA